FQYSFVVILHLNCIIEQQKTAGGETHEILLSLFIKIQTPEAALLGEPKSKEARKTLKSVL
ncbi:hypothetical protein ABEW90_20760, partial [Bacillus subtilis]|nr:hypothetical protein [Bacillus subtilis]